MYAYISLSLYIYIYICTNIHIVVHLIHIIYVHPVRNPSFASFRTQPLENLSAAVKLPIKNTCLGSPTLGEHLVTWILAMRNPPPKYIYIYIYICMYIYIYICMHIHIHVYIYIYMYIYRERDIYIHMYYIYIYIYIYICTYK